MEIDLQKIIQDFIDSKIDTDDSRDEWYGTPKSFTEEVMKDFIKFMEGYIWK